MKTSIFRYLKIFGFATIIAATVCSCSDFLEEGTKTALTEEQIYSDSTNIESNLQKLYTNWKGLFKDRFIWECMVGTDEIQSGAFQALKEDNGRRGALDKYDALLTSELSYITEQWDNRWPSVGEAAKIINANEKKDLSHGGKLAQLFGEASFIRGGLMMELTMLYGRVPIIDIGKADKLGYGRQPLKDVWTAIQADLQNAVTYCPATNTPARATSYAANMLLGYAYMAAPEETGLRSFEKAKEALEKVVNGPFELVPYYDLWDYNTPNTKESIFEWQFEPKNDPNQIQFQIGSRAVAALPGADAIYYAGYDQAVPTPWSYNNIADGGIWEEGDVRKEESLRYDFTYYGQKPDLNSISWEQLGDDHDELLPHIKKYEDFRTDQHSGLGINNMWNSGKNIPFLRLGNAILLYAECLNEMGQTEEAVKQVNKIRARAWDFNLPTDKAWKEGMSQDEFRKEIMTERVRELLGERWRKFDLIRTNHFLEYVKTRNKWAARSNTIQQYNIVWPIPLTEINQNSDISENDQNEGYK